MVTSGQAKLSSPKRSVVQAHVSPIVDPCHDKKPPATTASSAIQLSDRASQASKAPTATTKLPSMRCAGRTHHPDDITGRSFMTHTPNTQKCHQFRRSATEKRMLIKGAYA